MKKENIIVFEGIDRVGKTSLANLMCGELHKLSIFKHDESMVPYSKMNSNNESDKMLQLLSMAEMFECDVIFDRFHMSDFVYGVLNRSYDFSEAMNNFKVVDRKLASLNSVLVFVKPIDIGLSSKKHGKDLTMFEVLMEMLADISETRILQVDYGAVNDDKRFEKLKDDIVRMLDLGV